MSASDVDAAALLSALVAIPSVNPAFRREGEPNHWFGEAALGAYVAEWLRRISLDVEIDEVLPGRPNVVARLQGRPGGKRFLWEGHLDTVQASGMTIAHFEPVLWDGRLYGRGAVDDKGCLAAFMLALSSLSERPNVQGRRRTEYRAGLRAPDVRLPHAARPERRRGLEGNRENCR